MVFWTTKVGSIKNKEKSHTAGTYIRLLTPLVFHLLMSALVVGMVFSTALASVGFTGIGILSILQLRALPRFLLQARHRQWSLLFLLFFMMLISALWAQDPNWNKLPVLAQLPVIPWVFYAFRREMRAGYRFYLYLLLASLILAAAYTVLFSLIPSATALHWANSNPLFADIDPGIKSDKFGGYSPFLHRLQFSYMLGAAILLLPFLKKRFLSAAQILLAALLFLWALVLLGGRAAQLALLVSGGLGLAFFIGRILRSHAGLNERISALLAVFFVVIVLFISSLLLYKFVEPVKQRYNQAAWELEQFEERGVDSERIKQFTTVLRLYSWKYSLLLIAENPLLGTGLGDFHSELRARYQRDGLDLPAHAHNQFLYYWATGGIVTFVAFVSFFLLWTCREYRENRCRLCLLIFLFYFIVFFFDVPLNYIRGNAFFIFLLAYVSLLNRIKIT